MSAKFFGLFAAALCAVISPGVYAQQVAEAPQASEETVEEVGVVSETSDNVIHVVEVDVTDAVILEADDEKVDVEFKIVNNGDFVQPNVKYGILVIARDLGAPYEGSGYLQEDVTHTMIYDDLLTLDVDEEQVINASLTLPGHIKPGTYSIAVRIGNNAGLNFGRVVAGEITLNRIAVTPLTIDGGKCYVKIGDERFSAQEGVDIAKDEDGYVHCPVINHTDKDQVITMSATTYDRNFFGDIVVDEKLSEELIVPANETKEVYVKIPKAEKSGAYQISMIAKRDGLPITNPVEVRYVIQGLSASVLNIRTDKANYKAGEEANVQVFMAGSADQFAGSRAGAFPTDEGTIFDIQIMDENGAECGMLKDQYYDKTKVVADVVVPIESACDNVHVVATVKDNQGLPLDSLVAEVEETVYENGMAPANPQLQQETTTREKTTMSKIMIGAIAFSLILAVVILLVRAKKSVAMLVVFFGLSGVMLFGNVHDAKAALSCIQPVSTNGYTEMGDFCAETSLNQSVYDTCDNRVQVDGYVNHNVCGNLGPHIRGVLSGPGTTVHGSNVIIDRDFNRVTNIPHWPPIDFTVSGTGYLNVPNNPGNYNACIRYTVTGGWGGSTPVRIAGDNTLNLCRPYTVNSCNITGNLTADTRSGASCAGGGQNGIVDIIVSNVQGGSGTIEYRYRCGSSNWSRWGRSNTHTCTFTTPGNKTVQAETLPPSLAQVQMAT
jgi:hypothetical protein